MSLLGGVQFVCNENQVWIFQSGHMLEAQKYYRPLSVSLLSTKIKYDSGIGEGFVR